MKFRDVISTFLKKQGVDTVFGHTGAGNIDLIESLASSGIKVVYSRNEGNAVYLADGYSKARNIISVVTSTTGCGATNMVTGLANAYSDEVPMVALCAINDSHNFGLNNHQDGTGRWGSVDQNEIMRNSCKQAIFIFDPNHILNALKEAFRISQSDRKGPVYIGIPKDFWNVEIDQIIDNKKYRVENDPIFNNRKIGQIYELIYKSENPLILVGNGICYSNVREDFDKFIKKIKVPFAISPIAKDFIDESNDYYLGSARLRGSKHILQYLSKSDLIVLLGNRLTELEFGNNTNLFLNKKIIQIDKDQNEIGRIIPVDEVINSNGIDFLNFRGIKAHKKSAIFKKTVTLLIKESLEIPQKSFSEIGMNPFYIPRVLEKYSGDKAVFVVDSGFTKTLFISKLFTKLKQRFIVADKFSPMGYSIPASIGAAISGEKEVYCLVGDGSFQMTFNELIDILDLRIKIILILLNNGGMKSVKKISNSQSNLINFSNPNFSYIARSVGMNYHIVKKEEDLIVSIRKARQATTSQFIEIKIDQDLIVWDINKDKENFGIRLIKKIQKKLKDTRTH